MSAGWEEGKQVRAPSAVQLPLSFFLFCMLRRAFEPLFGLKTFPGMVRLPQHEYSCFSLLFQEKKKVLLGKALDKVFFNKNCVRTKRKKEVQLLKHLGWKEHSFMINRLFYNVSQV